MSTGGRNRKLRRKAEQSDDPIPPPIPELTTAFCRYLVIFAWCAGVTVLLHFPMLFKPHSEGDEIAYFVLSQRMGWDLSNYTTKDDPRVNAFPYTIYRNPLFHHPPLLPLILKAGSHLTSNPLLQLMRQGAPRTSSRGQSDRVAPEAVAAAFVFMVLVSVAALWYACRLFILLEIEPRYGALALVGITLCPLLLFSTVRIHHDGLAGLLLFCGFVAFAEALERRRVIPAVEAAFWFVAAMNVRFNAIAALPLLLLMPLYSFTRPQQIARKSSPSLAIASLDSARLRPRWLAPAIVWKAVLTVGMQHYYRLFAVYGTLWPGAIILPIGDVAKFSPFLAISERMSRPRACWDLATIFPFTILLSFLHSLSIGRLC